VRLRQGAWIAALVLAVPAWAHVRGVRADRALVRWLDEGSAALAAGDLVRADVLMERHLVHVARALEPGDARVWYQIGVQHARRGRRPAAAEALRTALRLDPGMTEARLDLATVQEIEERPQDAAVTLEEARRQDPTRFDVALRLGHLALGDEPVPGEPGADLDIETVLRRYNEAQRIDPTQPANLVAQARVARRLGDLAGAGIALRAAQRQLGGDLPTLPAELLQESFRLAELEGTDEAVACGILTWALRRRPTSAGRILREAERFLALGREREEATKAAVDPDVLGAGGRLDLSDAQRAYDAAARRLAALLLSGLESPAPHLAAARQDAEARLWRRALARYRALLAWTQVDPGAGEHDLPVLLEALARRGDLLVEAAQVAQRVDARLARTYFTRGHALIGAELLAAGEIEHALRLLKGVVEDDPDAAELRLAYARALARHGDLDDAERQLLTALAQDPHLREAAAATTDLVSLRDRPRVRAALAR
jgi:tetratricopeptide (TPR) repeat protein